MASGRTGGHHGPGVRSVRVEGASSSRATESGVRRGDQPSMPTDGELFLQVSPPRELVRLAWLCLRLLGRLMGLWLVAAG